MDIPDPFSIFSQLNILFSVFLELVLIFVLFLVCWMNYYRMLVVLFQGNDTILGVFSIDIDAPYIELYSIDLLLQN